MTSSGCPNYFGCNSVEFERIRKVFPVFAQIEPFLKYIASQLKGLKLDRKETALFSALIVYTINHDLDPAYNGLIWTLNGKLCKVLTQYMQLRRNQTESCEILFNLLALFDKITLKLRNDICQTLKQLGPQLGSLDIFHEIVFYRPLCQKQLNQH